MSEMANSVLNINDLVMKEFQSAAEDCLLFTTVTSISYQRRKSSAITHDVWSWKANRTAPDDIDKLKTTMISTIYHQPQSPKPSMNTCIRVSERTQVPQPYQELRVKYRMASTISLGMATRADVEPSSRGRNKVFSSMPLPLLLPLPVSVDASFILADDRRSIRFDESGMENLESKFNRWLLSDALPPLYYALLAALQTGNVMEWWPRPRSSKHPLASPLLNGFYKGLATCEADICVDVIGNRLAPRTAIFLPSDHENLSLLYRNVIRPSGLVHLPSLGMQTLAHEAGVIQMNQNHAQDYLLAHTEELIEGYEEKTVKIDDIQALIEFLEPNRLLDLPLLALADGSLATFSQSHKLTFIAKNSVAWSMFPANRFVHPGLNLSHLLVEQSLRVSLLNGTALEQLIRDRISEGSSRDLSAANAAWVMDLWRTIDTPSESPFDDIDITRLPLVPTANEVTHVSLASCTIDNTGILVAPQRDRFLKPIMEHFGAKFLNTQNFPPALLRRLGSDKFDLNATLRFLRTIGPAPLRMLFDRLSSENQKRFAEWVVDSIRYKAKKDLRNLEGISDLPVWTCYRGTSTYYETMLNMLMLPQRVAVNVVRPFLTELAICEHSSILNDLGKQAMTFSELRDRLSIPDRLEGDDQIGSYHRLLEMIIDRRVEDFRPPMVPNRLGDMVFPSELYSSTREVFIAAFAAQPNRFIHTRFTNQQSSLVRFGLRNTVDLETFLTCARAFHLDDTSPDRFNRAVVLFNWYNDHLPREAANLTTLPATWRELDELTFIPAHRERRRGIMWSTDYVDRLEEDALRSPGSMLRPEHQGIAWTQRFLFAVEPSRLLLFADTLLGVPTAKNVVSNLFSSNGCSQLLTIYDAG
jgi:hypothetical protein